jgi:RES domain-containing protein
VSLVCTKCFDDKIAQRFIRKHGRIGNCHFCRAQQRKTIEPYKLRDLFTEVVDLYDRYEPAPGSDWSGGETLAYYLQEWEIFNEDGEQQTQNEILDEIMGFDPRDGDISASDDWQAKSDRWTATPLHELWPWFADYLKRSRRFIIEEDPSREIVRPETWVPNLIRDADAILELKKNKQLFRGRLGFMTGRPPHGGRLPLSAEQMQAPPPRAARAGRANPEGISVLYCAFEPETAIVETGRFPGAVVSLRELRTRKPLRLADLRGKRSVIEPLATPNLAKEVARVTLLRSLGRALAEPIHPEDSSVEYVPT